MSVDREYRIRVVSTSEGGGVRQASEEMGELGKETDKTRELHHGLHGVVRQLQREYPELGHLAHAAFNPITLVVGTAIAITELYKTRVEELTKAFSSPELSDSPFTNIWKAGAMTRAINEMGDSVRKATEAYHSVEEASGRAAKKFEHELELVKALLEARKDAVGLANLEAEAERVRIENDRLKADQLEKDAKAKMERAGRIHVGTDAEDQASTALLASNAEKARKDMEDKQAELGEFDRYRAGGMSFTESEKYSLSYYKKYGATPPDVWRGNTQAAVDADQSTIDMYEKRLKQEDDRERQRKLRDELVAEAAKEAGAAATIRAGLPDRASDINQNQDQNRWYEQFGMGRRPSIRGNTLLGNIESMEALSYGEKISPEQLQSMDRLVQVVRMAGGNNDKIAQMLKTLFDVHVSHEQKLSMLEASMAKLGNVVRYNQSNPQ